MDNRFEEMYADGTLAELLVNCKKEELADALKDINEEYKNYKTVKCHTYDDSDAAGYKTAGFHPTETDFYFVFETEGNCRDYIKEYPPVEVTAAGEHFVYHFDITEECEEAFTESVAVVDSSDMVIGGCMLTHDPDAVCISDVFIDESMRKKGLATILIEEIKKRCPGKILLLHADSYNPHAVALYNKCGFVVKERLYSFTSERE